MSRVAIVTGYSSGLGEALTHELLRRGWSIVGVSRDSEPADLHAANSQTLRAVHGGVQNQDTVEAAFKVAEELGELRLVINCAGVGVFGEVGGYNAQEIGDVVGSNLSGLILFSDRASRELRSHGGHLVNIMSTAGKKLRTAESVYVAAKWGAKAYTRTLREALKAEKAPIKVIEVYPPGMRTPFWSSALRAPSDGLSFPLPDSIAFQIVDEIESERPVYCQEMVFERS